MLNTIKNKQSNKLYISNLPFDLTDAHVIAMLGVFGVINDCSLVYDHRNGRSRGFGFATMETPTAAANVIRALHGTDAGGRTLCVESARSIGRREAAAVVAAQQSILNGATSGVVVAVDNVSLATSLAAAQIMDAKRKRPISLAQTRKRNERLRRDNIRLRKEVAELESAAAAVDAR
jgi:RNA recognition motif-containing protein